MRKFLEYAQKLKADEIEIFSNVQEESTVTIRNGAVEKIETSIDQGLSIRVYKDQRFGFCYTTSLRPEDVFKTIEKAIESTGFTEPDSFYGLPAKNSQRNKNSLGNFDRNMQKVTTEQLAEQAVQMEKTAKNLDKRITKTESAVASKSINHSRLVNSHGIDLEDESTSCGISVELVAEENNQMEAAYDYQYSTHYAELNPKKIGETAAKKALMMLGAQSVPTGKYTLILPPKTAVNFLSVILPCFSADNVQKQKSFLKNKLGKFIASNQVVLMDDPFLVGGLGSVFYDAEGMPTTQKKLIERGILQQYLYDGYTARKDGLVAGGNSVRGSIKIEPAIGCSNLYLKPGDFSADNLIKKTTKGLLIHSIMGLHTADPISGDYSLGASGQLIEDGKIVRSVKDIAIAGNLQDFLKSIATVCNDLEFSGSLGSPTISVKDIMTTGK